MQDEKPVVVYKIADKQWEITYDSWRDAKTAWNQFLVATKTIGGTADFKK